MKNIIICILFVSVLPAQKRVMIEGEAEYKFSDNETLIEAKALCYNMALRNAVESYQIFVSSMTDVQNLQLRNDIIQTLSTGYLDDLTVVDEKIDKVNNSIYYKLKAYIQPEPFKKALKQQVARKINFVKPASIIRGVYLEIINIRESAGDIYVLYKQIYKSPTGRDDIMIDYFDSDGLPIPGDKKHSEWSLENGEIRAVTFQKPVSAKSYRVRIKQ